MRYYKYLDIYTYDDQDGETYIEVDDGWEMRRLTIFDDEVISSNVDFALSEEQIDYEGIEEVTPISQDEFEQVWSEHLASNAVYWEEAKAMYPAGVEIVGAIKVFFPQGVIVSLDDYIFGVADYEQCRESTAADNLNPGHRVTGAVTGYDEVNQWIRIGFPRVYADMIDMGE